MLDTYIPPFTMTDEITNLVMEIAMLVSDFQRTLSCQGEPREVDPFVAGYRAELSDGRLGQRYH